MTGDLDDLSTTELIDFAESRRHEIVEALANAVQVGELDVLEPVKQAKQMVLEMAPAHASERTINETIEKRLNSAIRILDARLSRSASHNAKTRRILQTENPDSGFRQWVGWYALLMTGIERGAGVDDSGNELTYSVEDLDPFGDEIVSVRPAFKKAVRRKILTSSDLGAYHERLYAGARPICDRIVLHDGPNWEGFGERLRPTMQALLEQVSNYELKETPEGTDRASELDQHESLYLEYEDGNREERGDIDEDSRSADSSVGESALSVMERSIFDGRRDARESWDILLIVDWLRNEMSSKDKGVEGRLEKLGSTATQRALLKELQVLQTSAKEEVELEQRIVQAELHGMEPSARNAFDVNRRLGELQTGFSGYERLLNRRTGSERDKATRLMAQIVVSIRQVQYMIGSLGKKKSLTSTYSLQKEAERFRDTYRGNLQGNDQLNLLFEIADGLTFKVDLADFNVDRSDIERVRATRPGTYKLLETVIARTNGDPEIWQSLVHAAESVHAAKMEREDPVCTFAPRCQTHQY